jgi:acyl-[acyl-carrier-protein]-phospholipid O-acyltransferase / long-chain-fatty-acid--[acyl-carrier-protein] ligase
VIWPWALAAILAAVLLLALWRPYIPGRALLWLFVRLFYRMDVIGRENIPTSGPALLVCNHVSYIDWVLLLVAQRRFIRFVIFAGWTRMLFIRYLLRWGKVIPIDASSGPKAVLKSLRAGGEALASGDLVCIFAEGRFTRTGFLLPFHRGFEQIIKNQTAPIIPVCLDELWGSIFSFYGDRTLWKWPRMVPYPLTVAFGKPMPPTASASEVRSAVQKLAADCAVARTERCRPVHREFVRAAARRPLRPCIIEPPGAMTAARTYRYSTVLTRASFLAQQLKQRVNECTTVGIWLPPGIEAVTAHIATAFCGKAVVHLDAQDDPKRTELVLQRCGVSQILTTDEYLARCPLPSQLQQNATRLELVDVRRLAAGVSSGRQTMMRLCSVLLPGRLMERRVLKLANHRLDDLAAVLLTTGRTGEPKGVLLTHRNLVAAASSLAKSFDLAPRDRIMSGFRLNRAVGYTFGFWGPLSVGAAVVAVPDNHAPAEMAQSVRSTKCTVLSVPPQTLAQRSTLQASDLASVRLVVCSGAKLEAGTAAQFEERFRIKPLQAYDCTEMAGIVATNSPDKTLENFTQVGSKPGTVGQPIAGASCRIVDAQTLEPLPPEQSGLLQVCGANLMQGYLGQEELTAKMLSGEWFNTGDQAVMDEDGFITII